MTHPSGFGALRRPPRKIQAWVWLLGLCACASTQPDTTTAVSAQLQARLGSGLALDKRDELPPRVDLDDGLTEDEAVALALWNSPLFRAGLADLGLAEADLFGAEVLVNPTLSLLEPVGPGLLEGLITMPLDVLRRSARIAAAQARLDQQAFNQVQAGVALARDVRNLFAALVLAEARVGLLEEDAQALAGLALIVEQRAGLGRTAGLDGITARATALQAEAEVELALGNSEAARLALWAALGLDLGSVLILSDRPLPDTPELPELVVLEARAFETRSDWIAANLAVEAAEIGRRRIELDVLQPAALVDLGQLPGESLKVSGGRSVKLPIFDQGQGARGRVEAVYERAVAQRDAVELRIRQDLGSAYQLHRAAQAAIERLDGEALPAADQRLELGQQSLGLGRGALLLVLEAQRARILLRLRRADAKALRMRARAGLQFGLGGDLAVLLPERVNP